MDVVGSTVDKFVPAFDLEKNNFMGIFSNMTLLNMLLISLYSKNRPFPKTKTDFKRQYDYIIVGGGTAGSVLANRLSEIPCVSVLLLEAGGDAPMLSEVPSYARIFMGTYIDWRYKTVPQKYGAFGQKENRVIWNSGKALGGSSVLNAMLYVRGNKKNYDDWMREGATGWSYRDVLPYFKKLEDNKYIADLDPGYHRTGGLMTVEKPKYTPEIKIPILEATDELGYKLTDVNGKRQTGIYDLQGTLRNGQRCSTAKAYLVPAENRRNLDILKNAFARKILIKNRKAYGVEFDFKDETHEVYSKKEVIISSGSVRTPQILMLSGIGPAKHLKKFDIPVIADLPVGKNLQDHAASFVHFLLNSTITPIILKNTNPVNVQKYIAKREGPLASTYQCTVLAFLDGLNTTATSDDFPRQELYFGEYDVIDARLNCNMKPEVYKETYEPFEGKPSYTCLISQTQPYSRGRIELNSTDPYDPPLIDPNYFEDERDLKDIVEGMKICLAVGRSRQMRKLSSRPFPIPFAACENKTGDEFLACQAKQLITTIWHPVGTARMGQPNDPRSVVDPELWRNWRSVNGFYMYDYNVIGIDNLRVVNAAVMPVIPSGNTNVPTMMVAEKASDIMKKGIKCNRKCRRH